MSELSTAALLRFQNLVLLCKQLNLRVAYKIHKIEGTLADGAVDLTVVVHVLNDSAFKKYLNNCSLSDLLLFRGLLVKLRAQLPETKQDPALTQPLDPSQCPGPSQAPKPSQPYQRILGASVQQAFLPKFENEGQDAKIADAIIAGADDRYMVITIKHSGSLVTLSAHGFAAKNSVDNEYTAGGEALLLAHFQRMYKDQAQQRLQAFVDALRERKLAVSFEMVTGSHGHHGQVPQGEYLMALSAHTEGPSGAPVFLGANEFTRLCLEYGLPVNDTWLVAGRHWAQRARELLDDMNTQAWTTDKAVAALTELVGSGGAAHCVHLPGTYPHHEWQGSRLEGFVIAQGQPISPELHQQLMSLQQGLAAQVVHMSDTPAQLVNPYGATLERHSAAGGAKAVEAVEGEEAVGQAAVKATAVDSCMEEVRQRTAGLVPKTNYDSLDSSERQAVIGMLEAQQVLPQGQLALAVPGQAPVYSRAALSKLDAAGLRQVLLDALAQGHAADASQAQQLAAELEQLAMRFAEHEAETASPSKSPGSSPSSPPSTSARETAGQQVDMEAEEQAAAQVVVQAEDQAAAQAVAHAAAQAAVQAKGLALQRELEKLQIKAMQALGGRPTPVDKMLRYKKKMVLWGSGHVGYCCMTFVIRNGLTALANGQGTYLSYVDSLISNWALSGKDKEQVRHFARCWAAWVQQHKVLSEISSERYLHVAEGFVADFLAGRCTLAPGKGSASFQGILVCLDCEAQLVEALRERLQLQNVIDPKSVSVFLPVMVTQGTLIAVPKDAKDSKDKWAKNTDKFFNKESCQHVFLVARKPEVGDGEMDSNAKRRQGMFNAKRKPVENPMHAALGSEQAGRQTMMLPEQPLTSAEDIAAEADRIAGWLGRGAPLPAADPAYIAAFITIPGSGKSTIAYGMEPLLLQRLAQQGLAQVDISSSPSSSKQQQAGGGGGQDQRQQQAALQLKVLTCDKMRQQPGYIQKDYWSDVAVAAVTRRGQGSSTLVVADRNLVLQPKSNLTTVAHTLNSSGATTIAIIPTTTPSPSAEDVSTQDQQLTGAEYPFPLEFAALCWLRVLQRKNHEGRLDAAEQHALKVMVSFTNYYKHETLRSLKQELLGHFDHVCELPVMRTMDSETKGHLAPVFEHMVAGLRDAKKGQKAQKALPDSWEDRMRELLLQQRDVQQALTALQLPLDDVTAQLAEMVAAVVAAGPGKADPNTRLRYIGVSCKQWQQPVLAAVQPHIPEELHEQLKQEELHVTLWHREDVELGADEQLRDALAAAQGQTVRLRVVAVYHSPEVSCAEVELLGGAPDAAFATSFPHMTLRTAEGVKAKGSLELPARLAAGDNAVSKVVLQQPLVLEGVITAVK